MRRKYRDVILPMTVLRRLDAVLGPTKRAVLDMKARLDAAGVANQDAALRGGHGAFYALEQRVSRHGSSTSCSRTRPMGRVGRPTSVAWVARRNSGTRTFSGPRLIEGLGCLRRVVIGPTRLPCRMARKGDSAILPRPVDY